MRLVRQSKSPWYMCLRNGATAGKMRVLFERGDFPDHISTYEALLRQQRLHERERDPRISKSETCLLDDVREVVGTRHEDTNPDMSLSDIGLSSLDLVRIKARTGQRLDISLSIIAIIKDPTVRALCKAVDAHLIQLKGGNARHSERVTLPPAQPPRDPMSDGVVEQGADIEYDLVVALRDTGW